MTVRELRDESASGDEEDNRGEGKVTALVGLSGGRKNFCFCSCTQSEIEPANLQNTRLGREWALSTAKQNLPSLP